MKEIANEINKSIKNSEVYLRYLKSKESISNNEYLVNLKNKMDLLKERNCKEKDDSLIDEYYKLESEYNNNILVKEYMKNKEELYFLLKEISDILCVK